MKTNFKFSQ